MNFYPSIFLLGALYDICENSFDRFRLDDDRSLHELAGKKQMYRNQDHTENARNQTYAVTYPSFNQEFSFNSTFIKFLCWCYDSTCTLVKPGIH